MLGRRWPGHQRALGWWVEGLTGAEPVLLGRTDSAIRDSPLSSSPARLRRHAQGQQMSCAGKAPDGVGSPVRGDLDTRRHTGFAWWEKE